MKMNWDTLLNEKRFKKSSSDKLEFDNRNSFSSDYSRIIFSSSFRRLQDKTQVFPLKRGDFVRTRLTHSLEVSHIASSMGKAIEYKKQLKDDKISSILAVAGLIHDIGNPPFGHFGEFVIQKFFKEFFKKNNLNLSQRQENDLIYFDGNVQTFRILKKLQYLGNEFGYNLTYGTLATIIKYPKNSVEGNKKNSLNIEEKKFGYFLSEDLDYKKINDELGLNNNRHPLTYLLEASDDIAYCIADIEDGIQKKLITLEDIKEQIHKYKDRSDEKNLNSLIALDENIKKYELENIHIKKSKGNRLYEKIIIQKIKIYLQSQMINNTISTFLKNEDDILNGIFKRELLDVSSYKEIKNLFKNLAENKIFNSKERVEIDLLGYQVIDTLLNIFVSSALEILDKGKEASIYSKGIYSLISDNYKLIYEEYEMKNAKTKEDKIYNTLKLCTDFISGMTDTFALELYKKLKVY